MLDIPRDTPLLLHSINTTLDYNYILNYSIPSTHQLITHERIKSSSPILMQRHTPLLRDKLARCAIFANSGAIPAWLHSG